jgi:glycosyltransferase involved in cell wall biosynthesis
VRIALDATALPGKPGGAGYYIINLVRSLLDIETSHEFVVLTHLSDRHLFNLSPEKEKFLTDVPDLSRGGRLVWEQFALPKLLKQLQIDLLHSPHYTMPLWTTIPVVVTYHDMTFFLYPSYHTLVKRFFFPFMIRQSARRSSALIAVSESTRQDAIRLLGISPKNITSTLLGYDSSFVPIEDQIYLEQVRQKYQLPGRFIFNVGTIEPRKNQLALINAFDILADTDSNIALVLVGGAGWYYNQLSQQIIKSPNRDRIYLIGYVDRVDMPALYNLAEVFVYPSIYEGFGLPLVEALACGRPIITSNISALPEIVSDAGLLVSPNDCEQLSQAIRKLLEDKNLATEIGQKALVRAKEFSWRKTAEQTLEIYERVNREHG